MPLSIREIHPCDKCKGKLGQTFYVVDTSIALVKASAVNELAAMHQFFGGQSLQLAELFSPSSGEIAVIGSEQDKKLNTRLLLCQRCFIGDVNLAVLAEERNIADDEASDAEQ